MDWRPLEEMGVEGTVLRSESSDAYSDGVLQGAYSAEFRAKMNRECERAWPL